MKHIRSTSLLGISAMLLVASTSQGATLVAPSSLQEGLALYMNFDGSTPSYDSYTGYTGGINWFGNPTLGGTGAFTSTGFNPSGSNGGAANIGQASISSNNFTFSFQFKDIALSNNKYALRMTTTAGQTLQFETLTGGTAGQIQLYVAGGSGNFYAGSSGDLTGTTNLWQTLTMTSSSSGLSIYLNGQKVATSKALDAGTLNFFQIGCNDNGNDAGSLKTDDVALWNRVLTDEEIAFIAKNPANKAIPEPATATLGLLALAGLVARRRRHS